MSQKSGAVRLDALGRMGVSERRFAILAPSSSSIPNGITSASCTSRSDTSSPGIRSARSRLPSIGRIAFRASPRCWPEPENSARPLSAGTTTHRFSSPRCASGAMRAAVARKPSSDELGARPFQDRERRLPCSRRSSSSRFAGSMRLGGVRRAPTRSSGTTASGAKSGSEWGSSTFRLRTRRSRRGAGHTNGGTFGLRTRTSASARRPVICSRRGFRGSSRRPLQHLRDAGRG